MQAHRDVLMGMQYLEVRQLFLDLYKQHAEPLLAEARATAERRATEVLDAFITQAAHQPQAVQENLREPGVQRALMQAQVEHVASGDADELPLWQTCS